MFKLSFLYFFPPADFELAQLQEKLRETELVMENIVSNAHHSPDRWVCALTEDSFHQPASSLSFPDRNDLFDGAHLFVSLI